MIVTDIRRIDDKRYCLYIDYEPYASVYTSDIKRLRLEIGAEIEGDRLESFRRDYLYKRAMNKAVNSIKFSDKCEYEIVQKLRDLYYDEEIIAHTVGRLKEYGYIDDYRYAGGYIRRNSSKKGAKIIRYELQSKHIDQNVIDRAMADSDIPDENDRIYHILQKRYSDRDLIDNRKKVLAYMYNKGFDGRKVSQCIEKMLEDTKLRD